MGCRSFVTDVNKDRYGYNSIQSDSNLRSCYKDVHCYMSKFNKSKFSGFLGNGVAQVIFHS